MVVSQRGYLTVYNIGDLADQMEVIKRIRLHYKGKPIQRNYFACWSKENTNYYIEEFVQIYKDLLHK